MANYVPVTSLKKEQILTKVPFIVTGKPKFLPVADKFCLILTCDRQSFAWTVPHHELY